MRETLAAGWGESRAASLADQMQDDLPGMRAASMLEQVNALPGTQHQFAITNRYRNLHQRQGAANVRRHVVFAFHDVPIERPILSDQPPKEGLQIAPHVGVGVLLNDQRRAGMLAEDGQQSALEMLTSSQAATSAVISTRPWPLVLTLSLPCACRKPSGATDIVLGSKGLSSVRQPAGGARPVASRHRWPSLSTRALGGSPHPSRCGAGKTKPVKLNSAAAALAAITTAIGRAEPCGSTPTAKLAAAATSI